MMKLIQYLKKAIDWLFDTAGIFVKEIFQKTGFGEEGQQLLRQVRKDTARVLVPYVAKKVVRSFCFGTGAKRQWMYTERLVEKPRGLLTKLRQRFTIHRMKKERERETRILFSNIENILFQHFSSTFHPEAA